jgi:phytoene/squalene synthetase
MYINSEKQNLVASFYDDPETVAMFQLFAAAPDMLEALERMMANSVYDTDLDKYTIEMSGFVANINKSIIAKAKGEQP